MINNGFYNLSDLNDEELKSLMRDAINSTNSRSFVDKKDSNRDSGWARQRCYELTPLEYVEKYVDVEQHNVCIDRSILNKFRSEELLYELGSCTNTNRKFNIPYGVDYFLFIYVTKDEFAKLIEKYDLTFKYLT